LGDPFLRFSFEKFFVTFSPRNSSVFLWNTSLEIPEKFLGLGHHVDGFLGEFIKRISFEKFLGISTEFYLKKILRISPDYYSGNSWEILSTWSPSLPISRGIINKKCQ